MDKEQELLFTVNGFIFGSQQDAELAQQELNTARYIEKKIENKSPATMLAIYKASIDKKMFRTPVGYAYLHDLQKRMASQGIAGSDIGGIPLYQIFNNHRDDEKAPRVIKVKKNNDPLKRRNTLLTVINIVLVLLVIAMFAISVSGNRPTVLNYRRTIENEYSSWKQQLDEREKAVREKERELGIEYGNE